MSYVRWSENSDVYIYDDVSGGITIHSTKEPSSYNVETRQEMYDILRNMQQRAHKIPQDIMDIFADTSWNYPDDE